jgi:hypothetical protein
MTETHWKINFDYRYTGAYELKEGEEKILTIQRVCKEEIMDTTGAKQMCLVAYFKEANKPMVLNKTNCKTIEKLYSPYIENWLNKRVIVSSQKVKAFGDTIDALRIKRRIPEPEQKIDLEPAKAKIINCKTLDELKEIYSNLSPQEKAGTIQVKDLKKEQLIKAGDK